MNRACWSMSPREAAGWAGEAVVKAIRFQRVRVTIYGKDEDGRQATAYLVLGPSEQLVLVAHLIKELIVWLITGREPSVTFDVDVRES